MTHRPTDLDQFIGQVRTRERVQVLVHAALLADRPLPHLLFAAPLGMGKTALAYAIAGSVALPIHMVSMPADLRTVEALVRSERGLFLFDRLHEAPRALQARLPELLKYGCLSTSMGPVGNDDFTLIATTTDARRLPPELYDRFIVPVWEHYTPDELTQIVGALAARQGIVLSEETVAALGRAAGGTPRQAAVLVATAAHLLDSEAEPTLERILSQAGSSIDGLTDRHFAYLHMLDLCGGTATPALLSATLCLHPSVCADVERALVHDELVDYATGTRRLTNLGAARLRRHREEAA